MPKPDRADLLQKILTTGDRRRRMRLLARLGLVCIVLAGGVAFAWTRDDNRTSVTLADDTTTTTTSKPAATSAAVASTSTTDGATTTVATSTSTTTTEPPPECRNSYDPRCGPFYWDYDPATLPNASLEITISHAPEVIVAGEPVMFTVRFFDPDSLDADSCPRGEFPGGERDPADPDGGTFIGTTYHWVCYAASCPGAEGPFGPWDPPPPPEGRPSTRQAVMRYPEPGQYTITVNASSFAWCSFRGYDSQGSQSITIDVVAPPP